MSDAVAEFKSRARATWASGDYDSVSELILDVGPGVVAAVGVSAGDEVLDVAAGTGNASIPAALAGGRVTASDLTPELFEAGRRRAAAAGAEIDWVEADAEALPFDDERFDVVLSTFGAMFAPRHAVVADELARVLRPGGRLGMANWTPDGFVGHMFRTIAGFLPAPPEFVTPPPLWGVESHVEQLFAGKGLSFEFERRQVTFGFDSPDAMVSFYETRFGPCLSARTVTEPQGKWEELLAAYRELIVGANGGDGPVNLKAEYLLVRGTKG